MHLSRVISRVGWDQHSVASREALSPCAGSRNCFGRNTLVLGCDLLRKP